MICGWVSSYTSNLAVMMPLVDDICIPSISFSLVLIAMFHYQVIECRASYNARIFFFFLFGP